MQSVDALARHSTQASLARVLDTALEAALARLALGAEPSPEAPLRHACRAALEQLWCRRAALLRALLWAPAAGAVVDARDADSAHCANLLVAALQQAPAAQARAEQAGDGQWPFTPRHWAAALRQVVRWAAAEAAVQQELTWLGTVVLAPCFVDAWHRLPSGDEACAAPPAVAPAPERLIDAVRPGRWFRMVLMERWTDVCVTWCSDKGHFFMFSSRQAGRSHTLSRSGLTKLIESGRFRRRADPPAPGSGAE